MKNIFYFLTAGWLLTATGCHLVDDGPADMQVLRETRPVGETKQLSVDLEYDVGTMEIVNMSGDDLFSLDLEYDRRRSEPRFNFSGGDRASMTLDVESRRRINSRRGNDLTLRLNEKIPLRLNIRTGVSESHLDFGALDVRELRLDGGVGKTEVIFDRSAVEPMTELVVNSGVGDLVIRGIGNTRVQRMNLDGGVGRTELDFSGDLGQASIDAEIDVGVGQIKILVPRDAEVEIQAEGSFLSNVSAPSFERNGGTYRHKPEGGQSPRIFIRIDSGVGGVAVELI